MGELKKLTELWLYHTQITKAGVAELKNALLPECLIDHNAKE